jgi:hypothetical protein
MITLSGTGGFIELPSADLGEPESRDVTVNSMRAMDGTRYTHKQSSDRIVFTLTISNVDRRRMFDLQAFLKANIAADITLTDWDGDKYKGNFQEGDVPFQVDGRSSDGIVRREAGTITLNFVGEKV